MAPGPTLQELIDAVRADSHSEDTLLQLSQAARTVADLEQTSDALLGHFVDQCRRGGHSWSQISGSLGVSKQAAHKRFSLDIPSFERFTDRARGVVAQSEEEARRLGHAFVGTEHILLALIAYSDGVGAQVLAEAGITRSAAEAQIQGLIKRGTGFEERRLPFTPRAKGAIQSAVREALQMGASYVGTEHLLLGLFVDGESVAAKVLVELGADLEFARGRVVDLLAGPRGD